MNNIVTRFPPSPTGFLHVGNARIAIINWLFAKKSSGKILLRFDDTDVERSREQYKTQMKEDLNWLGLTFDETFEQSKRDNIYKDALNKLLEKGYVYPCFETEEELEIKRKLSLSSGMPPIYKQHHFTDEQKKENPYYRFKLKDGEIKWKDEIQGEISYNAKDLSDPVILRANGSFMYTFCSVVDDFLTNVSHIIRGADHITNTAIQIRILEALTECYDKDQNICFGHLPLFQGTEGKISKRVGGFSIKDIKEAGYEPLAILNLLSRIGLSYYDDVIRSKEELINDFDFAKFNKSQIIFDTHLIEVFNKKCIANFKYQDVKDRLSPNITEDFFEGIKHNCHVLKEVETWHDVCFNKELCFLNLLTEQDRAFVSNLFNLIKEKEVLKWEEILPILKENFPERKGKNLFLPIRLALTGKEDGPEMNFIFNNISKDIVQKRFM